MSGRIASVCGSLMRFESVKEDAREREREGDQREGVMEEMWNQKDEGERERDRDSG